MVKRYNIARDRCVKLVTTVATQSDMALIRSILRSLLKRLQTTLAMAQRIARFNLSSYSQIKERNVEHRIAETLLRSLTPEVPYGRTGEDGEESTSNIIRDEEMTSTGVENDEVPQGASEMISDEEEVENGLDSPMISGKSLVSGVERLTEVLEENGSAARENEVCRDTVHLQLI